MRHPLDEYNQRQAETLAQLPEDQREYMARMFRIGNATYCYHNRVKDLSVFGSTDTSPKDLVEWLEQQLLPLTESRSAREFLQAYFEEYLEGLPHEGMRRVMREEGLEKAKRSFPFRPYVLERHDIGMDEFLRQHLSPEDYAYHVVIGESVKANNERNG